MNAPDWQGRHGAPRPPRDIEAAMEAAGKAGDDIALGLARAAYTAWLVDQGYQPGGPHGTTRPDRSIR